MSVKTSPIPDYGHTFEIEQWIRIFEYGGFIGYDDYGCGHAQYCMKNIVIDGDDDGYVRPYDVKKVKSESYIPAY